MDITNNVTQQTVEELLGNAQSVGAITNQSMSSLIVGDIGAQIAAGLHTAPNQIRASEITLVSLLIDDSSSIQYGNNAQNIRDGHNEVLSALRGSTQGDNVLVHCRYLNGTVLYRYVTLDQAINMDANNYNPVGGTPLYDQTAVLLGTVLAQTQQFMDNGQQCRSISVVITDGADAHSRRHPNAQSVAPIVRDMISQENHIVAGIGVADGYTNFQQVFTEMGIPQQWILTSTNDAHSLRAAWSLVSRSAARVSQSSQAFSNSALGGFEL